MKNKGVIITIILILVLGVGITVETSQFVREKGAGSAHSIGQLSENDMMAGESLPLSAGSIAFDKPEAEAAAPEKAAGGSLTESTSPAQAPLSGPENRAQVQMEEASVLPEEEPPDGSAAPQESGEQGGVPSVRMDSTADHSTDTEASPAKQEMAEISADSSVAVSPLAPAAGPTSLIEILTREEYAKRLAEVDSLIENTKETNVSANTDSLKNIAEYEYRLWDVELNHIYQAVMSGMDEEESENLRTEEREWIRRRDSDAKKAASKYKGGTMENLEYTASLAASTRSRAYEILEDYGEYLPE